MRKYFSDKGGHRLAEAETTILKVNRRSPLHERYSEIHLSASEAEELQAWLAARPEVPAKASRAKASKPRSVKPTSPDRPQPGL